jgi:hypothetical protein
MMDALSSFETSVLTRATRRNIPEDAIHHFNFIPFLVIKTLPPGWMIIVMISSVWGGGEFRIFSDLALVELQGANVFFRNISKSISV